MKKDIYTETLTRWYSKI